MARAYAIGHEHICSLTCSVAVETNAEVSTLLNADVLTDYTLERVSLSSGFQRVRTASEDSDMHSLFFKVVEPFSITIFGTASIEKPVRVHAYVPALSSIYLLAFESADIKIGDDCLIRKVEQVADYEHKVARGSVEVYAPLWSFIRDTLCSRHTHICDF